jgi:hypothetical protein
VTSNRAPSEWPELFTDPLLASAALDRLLHGARVVLISGRSYRLAMPTPASAASAAKALAGKPEGKEGIPETTM